MIKHLTTLKIFITLERTLDDTVKLKRTSTNPRKQKALMYGATAAWNAETGFQPFHSTKNFQRQNLQVNDWKQNLLLGSLSQRQIIDINLHCSIYIPK